MKRLFYSVVSLMAFGFTYAQEASNVPITGNGFKAGDVFVTGSIGIGSESTGDDKTNSFNISPKVGYFLMENIAVGGALGYFGKNRIPWDSRCKNF